MIPFAEWRPDMPALGQWAREALNVVPAEESYRPLNDLSGVSSALTGIPTNVVSMVPSLSRGCSSVRNDSEGAG